MTRGRTALGEALLRARLAAGYSQRGLGEVVGLHQSVISRLENGRPIGLRLTTFLRMLDRMEVVRVELRVERGSRFDIWRDLPGFAPDANVPAPPDPAGWADDGHTDTEHA